MKEERIKQIISKIKETVGKNNYKLALAITGHRPGKIRDVSMASKDGELLLEYIQHLENNWKELKKWLQANDIHCADAIPFRETLRKMQELESDNNGKMEM